MQSAILRLTEKPSSRTTSWESETRASFLLEQNVKATTLEMVDAMIDEDSAIVSIYFGSDSDEDSANELAAAIEEKYPDVEVEVNDGGQPIYYYVISVE
mgnify:CR=1 FL=1